MAPTRVPGDVLRGTQEEPDVGTKGATEATPSKDRSQRFAERQSFADPVHKEGSPTVASSSVPSGIPDGGLRTQETASEEGARVQRPDRPSRITTHRDTLETASEEE